MFLSVFNLWRAWFKENLASPGSEECWRRKQFVGCCKGLSHNRILPFALHSTDALWRVPFHLGCCSLLCFPSHYLTYADLTSGAELWAQGAITWFKGAVHGDRIKGLIIWVLAAYHLVEGLLVGTCLLCWCGVTEDLRKVWKSNFSIN